MQPIAPAGFFALRTPLLPFDTLLEWGAELRAPRAPGDESALAADRATLRDRLRGLLARAEVREALFIASPSLEESLPHWLEAPDSERGLKVERTLCRYLPRMSARCTPFGLFAGCSTGMLGDVTRLELGERASYRRHTRLDMDYVVSLAETLARDPALRAALVYEPNSSLYRAAGKWRYAEAHVTSRRAYHLVALDPSGPLDQAIALAAGGIRPDALAEALVDPEAGIERDDAAGFVDELLDAQVLIPRLVPGVTGDEPIHQLIAALAPHAEVELGRQARALLIEARDWLAAHDATPIGAAPAAYRALAGRLEELPARVELARLYQVDMVKPAPGATLGRAVVDEMMRAIAAWHPLTEMRDHEGLDRFRDDFVKRYEDREVPLCEALDEESGIGFQRSRSPTADAAPLLGGLVFPPQVGTETFPWSARMALCLRIFERARASGAREIELTDADLAPLKVDEPHPLPDSFAVVATLHARDAGAIDAGSFRIALAGVAGPSSANLFGRFCHGDPELTRHVLAALRAEEALDPDVIYAEVVHLPEGRIGNILTRPALRAHEIPFLCASGVSGEHQLPVTDLLVSVWNRRILLRSARLGKWVVPRLTTAHNVDNAFNLGVYRFLCAFQQARASGIGWDWGPFEHASFLPRVVMGRLVLAEARWTLDAATLRGLGQARGAARFGAVQELRAGRGLPRFIAVADGDNELPVDLDNVLSVETFVQMVKDRASARLVEMFPDDGELCASGPEGRFTHELIVPFVRQREPIVRPPVPARIDHERTFAPGSSWLTLKTYAGAATHDAVLAEAVAPVVAEVTAAGAITGWFFLRFEDPDPHLRIRFAGDPDRLHAEVLPRMERALAPLIADGRVWRVQLDTYQREVERYGGLEGVRLAERLFHVDSQAVLGIVETLQGDAGSDARWQLALVGIDLMLGDLGLDDAGKHEIMRVHREAYGDEFRVDGGFERQLGEKYRAIRGRVDALLRGQAPELEVGRALLAARAPALAEIGRELRALEHDGRLGAPLPFLAMSYVHMHTLRILDASPRAQELVLYDVLRRVYESRLARAGKRPPGRRG